VSRFRLFALLAAALATALVLAACGDDDGGGGGSEEDEAAITETIETATSSTDASECTELQTQSFVEQTQYKRGEEAIDACTEDAGDTIADSVDVSGIEVDGDAATAQAAFTGGGLNGQTLTLSLVKEGDAWKLDRIDEFAEFDQGAFADALAEEASSDGESDQQLVDCVLRAVTDADSEELQSAYLSGDEDELIRLFAQCFGG
jgi:ABC-type glycerol-3-phosphate transport system substrate-binding protein